MGKIYKMFDWVDVSVEYNKPIQESFQYNGGYGDYNLQQAINRALAYTRNADCRIEVYVPNKDTECLVSGNSYPGKAFHYLLEEVTPFEFSKYNKVFIYDSAKDMSLVIEKDDLGWDLKQTLNAHYYIYEIVGQ